LVPQDDVVLHCSVSSKNNELGRVLVEKRDFIEQSVKQPVIIHDAMPEQLESEIIRESSDVKGAELHMVIVDRTPGGRKRVATNGEEAVEKKSEKKESSPAEKKSEKKESATVEKSEKKEKATVEKKSEKKENAAVEKSEKKENATVEKSEKKQKSGKKK